MSEEVLIEEQEEQNITVEIIDNLKHAITLELPKLVGKKIRDFLNKQKKFSTLG